MESREQIDDKARLKRDLEKLLQSIDWSEEEKQSIVENFDYFMECVDNEAILRDTTLNYCKEDDPEDENIEIAWEWPQISGSFGFFKGNGSGFGFDSKEKSWSWGGGYDGDDGFDCLHFISEFTYILESHGIIDKKK